MHHREKGNLITENTVYDRGAPRQERALKNLKYIIATIFLGALLTTMGFAQKGFQEIQEDTTPVANTTKSVDPGDKPIVETKVYDETTNNYYTTYTTSGSSRGNTHTAPVNYGKIKKIATHAAEHGANIVDNHMDKFQTDVDGQFGTASQERKHLTNLTNRHTDVAISKMDNKFNWLLLFGAGATGLIIIFVAAAARRNR